MSAALQSAGPYHPDSKSAVYTASVRDEPGCAEPAPITYQRSPFSNVPNGLGKDLSFPRVTSGATALCPLPVLWCDDSTGHAVSPFCRVTFACTSLLSACVGQK